MNFYETLILPSIPLDLYHDITDEDYIQVWSQSVPGGLPTNQVAPSQSELKFTTYWFVLLKLDGNWEQAVIPFTSSQLRISRKLTTDINRFRYDGMDVVPPLYAQAWKLVSVMETSKNGDDYFNFGFEEPTVLDFEADEATLTLASETYNTASDTPLLQTSNEPKPQLVDSSAMPY